MTYAANLLVEGITSQYLAVIKPRRLAGSWSLISGTKYYQLFDYGEITKLEANATEKTKATSSALSDGIWYYDSLEEKLYFDDGYNPATKNIVLTYEIYTGTFDAHWYRNPLDSTGRIVYYEPIIISSPKINASASESLFGYLPVQSSNITLSNAVHVLEKHLYDSSFYLCDVVIYHYLDKLTIANTKKVFSGLCTKISYDDKQIMLSLYDRLGIFDKEYRNVTGNSFYAYSEFSDLDPAYEGRPIRNVYGIVEGFPPVNIDYVADVDTPTVNDNRRYICIADETNLGSVQSSVPASPSSTTTRTYLNSANGFRVGDSVWFDKASDEYKIITNVNKTGNNYIEHPALSVACAVGNIAKRSFIGNITIYKEDVVYRPLFGRDYTEYTDATNKVVGFDLSTSLETNLGMPSALSASDAIYCRIYGHKNTVTLGAAPFGLDSGETGNLTQAIVVLFDMLKTYTSIAEDDIDLTTFSSLQSSIADEIGFAVPEFSRNDFPIMKDVVNNILKTLLLKIFPNNDLKWTIKQTAPLGSVDKSIEDDEILLNSFKYEFDYNDIISDAILEYAGREYSEKHQASRDYSRVTKTSAVTKYLHKIDRQKTFKSLHFKLSEAQTLVDRLNYALSERQGICKLSTKNRFFDILLGDNVKISRSRMPGFEYDGNILREREFAIISTAKSLDDIELELIDQKGIEDNLLSW